MLGWVMTTNQIVRQDNKWATIKTSEFRRLRGVLNRHYPNFERPNLHVFEKNVNEQTIVNLLNELKHPAPKLNINTLGITVAYLRSHADSLCPLYYKGSNEVQRNIFLSAINEQHVNSGILSHYSGYVMDSYVACTIKIVKKDNDTLFVKAENEHAYMLPWVINKRDTTYDKSIGNFAATVLGEDTACNMKPILQGGTIYSDIYDYVFRKYCEEAFTRQDYEASYPVAFARLKQVFTVTRVSAASTVAFLTLHPKTFPPNIFISEALNLANADSVTKAIQFTKALKKILKRSNFIFKYAADLAHGLLTFEMPGDSLSFFPNARGAFPYLSRFNDGEVITFRYQSKANERENSCWFLLPNGRTVLYVSNGDNIMGIPKQKVTEYMYHGYALFDEDGKLMRIGRDGEPE